jgi:formylglycine-generating enzyme required for sulfatase activity
MPNCKRQLIGCTLLLSTPLLFCGNDPGSPAPDPLQDLQRPIVMKDIPAGTFNMGEAGIAEPVHQVTLSAFRMQETEVTQEQYVAVMGINPAYFDTGATAPLRPVEQVSWYDAVKYCNALSLRVGLTAVYDTSTWIADFTKNGYRLPTEAQWEYACRGNTTTPYWWGADTNGMGARAWWRGNSDSTTHPVAAKPANAYGLCDMTGNVWEWCNDWYGAYSSGAQSDPPGPDSNPDSYRVIRGGSWNYTDAPLRSAIRDIGLPGYRYFNFYGFGFRVVLPRRQ